MLKSCSQQNFITFITFITFISAVIVEAKLTVAKQSSTRQTTHDDSFGPLNAIDGNYDTRSFTQHDQINYWEASFVNGITNVQYIYIMNGDLTYNRYVTVNDRNRDS